MRITNLICTALSLSALSAAITGCVDKSSLISSSVAGTPTSQTDSVVAAANDFLASLSAEQRSKVLFGYTPGQTAEAANFLGGGMGNMTFVGERYGDNVWSNYPVSDVPRAGAQLGSLTAAQREKALLLLKTVLSESGYEKVQGIMGADQVLADAGSNYAAGIDVYTLGIFGNPDATAPWMIGFQGHHLGLNITIAGAQGVMTPTLTGVQPATYVSNGQTIRPLAKENDKAFVLLDALDATQKSKAILNYAINDLVVGPGQVGVSVVPEGVNVSTFTDSQKALLLDVISEWAGILNEQYSADRLNEIKEGLNETYFAWSGPTTHADGVNGTAYYRIQGPKLIIEFSPQQVGGNKAMHVHTMYRDPTNDYGASLTTR